MEKRRLICKLLSLGVPSIKPAIKAAFLALAVLLPILKAGYAMQPPPPPLNLPKFKELISLADLIVVGKIGEVRETEQVFDGKAQREVEAFLSIEKILQGRIEGEHLIIKESYLDPNAPLPKVDGKDGQGMIVRRGAGPSTYHGQYSTGVRIVVLLEKTEGTHVYKPLGSGTYDKHLCEFLIESGGIKSLYFKFAEDMSHYAESEDRFVGLIGLLQKSAH
jgi:hypothetical protein